MANYIITVNFNGGQGDGYVSPNQPADKNNNPTKVDWSKLDDDFGAFDFGAFDFVQNGANGFAAMATVATLEQIGKNIFSHEIQRVGRYAGSQQAQDVANATLSIFGYMFSPISSHINLAYEVESSQYARQWENVGLQLYRERGGVALNRSRTER